MLWYIQVEAKVNDFKFAIKWLATLVICSLRKYFGFHYYRNNLVCCLPIEKNEMENHSIAILAIHFNGRGRTSPFKIVHSEHNNAFFPLHFLYRMRENKLKWSKWICRQSILNSVRNTRYCKIEPEHTQKEIVFFF